MIVIGAGPAGLGAAHQLTKLGAQVSLCCSLIHIYFLCFLQPYMK